MANANKLTLFIVIFMLMGILSGAAIHAYATPTTVSAWADNITLLTDSVSAVDQNGHRAVGVQHPDGRHYAPRRDGDHRPGRRQGDGLVHHLLGIIHSRRAGDRHLPAPGRRVKPGGAEEAVDTGLAVSGMSLKGFLSHTIPTSITEAMANNEILQIVVFSMFFGIAGASLGEKFNAPLVAALNVVSHIMLKVTGYVMYVAPLAIFAAISSVIASQGLGILLNYASFIGGYYLAVLLTSSVLIAVGYMVLKKRFSAC